MRVALLFIALSPALLWLLYVFGIQVQRGGWWRVFYPFAAAGLVLDWVLNYTVLAVITWDWPRPGERTFSRRLTRLIRGFGWRRELAAWVAMLLLDPFDPTPPHIKR